MNDNNSYFDLFDPRTRSGMSSSGRVTGDGEYVPRRPAKKQSTASPSPAKEGGDADFDVFNFDEARRRKREREEALNARLAAEERPRETVRRMAENQQSLPRKKSAGNTRTDSGVQRARKFAQELSGYVLPSASSSRRADTSARRKSGQSARTTTAGRKASGGRNSGGGRKKSGFASLPRPVRTIAVIGCVLLVLMLIYNSAIGVLLSGMGSIDLSRREDNAADGAAGVELMSGSGVTNILLLGIDDDGGEGSRSDTIMIASLDSRGGAIRLCSILRDCYVSIPGHGSNRINAAYAYGGAQLAVQTVENNFRVKIDHCVTIDMDALVDVVDAMGGVEIELTAAEANQVNLHSHCGLTTGSGLQLLNGKQAVTYARIRKIDSDFMRTQRQRTLINAIITKMRSMGVGELIDVVQAVSPKVATDMSSAQIGSLALKALPALSNELGQLTVPSDGTYSNITVDGMSVLKLDLEKNAKLLQSYIYGD